MSFLTTSLRSLNFVVLPLKATSVLLNAHLLLDKGLRSVFVVDATRVPLCWTLHDCADLRESWDLALPSVLLIMSVRIEDTAHFDKLQIALERCSEFGLRQVEPICACVGLIVLFQSR